MFLWIAVALAQEPSVPRMCADAAQGTEVDVCLRLAAENPDEVDKIAAALRGRLDRAATPDRELLLALLLLLSEETGAQGARQLGELHDPRAVPPLIHAANTRALPVATEAVRALGAYSEGLPPLRRWLLDPEVRLEIRVTAVQVLGQMGTDPAANAILDAVRRSRVPASLRQEMISTVQRGWPERATELDARVARDGTAWLSLAGGVGLGITMGTAGALGRANGLEWLGLATGGVAGASTGYLAGRAWPMEAHEAAFLATNGLMGTASGLVMGAALAPDSRDAPWYGGMAGAAVGYAGGFAFRKAWRGEEQDVADAFLVAATAAITAAAASGWTEANYGTGQPALAAGIGLAGGSVAGLALGPNIRVRGADTGMILLSAAYGTALGSLVPVQTDARGLLGLTTLGVGALAGYTLSEPVDPEWSTIAGGFAGMTFGATLGIGAGLLIDPDTEEVITGSALAGVTAGTAAGVLLTAVDPDPLDDRDVVLTVLSAGWMTWQSFGFASLVDSGDPRRATGVALMVPSATGAAVAASARYIDWPVTNAMAATSLGLWGAYLGGVGGFLFDQGGDGVLLTSLIASDIGVLGGGLAMSPIVRTPPLVVGIADAGGVLVGSLAALSTSFATDESRPILLASLIGAGAGFAAGVGVGTAVHRSGATRSVAMGPILRQPPRLSVLPTVLSDGATLHQGVLLEVSGW